MTKLNLLVTIFQLASAVLNMVFAFFWYYGKDILSFSFESVQFFYEYLPVVLDLCSSHPLEITVSFFLMMSLIGRLKIELDKYVVQQKKKVSDLWHYCFPSLNFTGIFVLALIMLTGVIYERTYLAALYVLSSIVHGIFWDKNVSLLEFPLEPIAVRTSKPSGIVQEMATGGPSVRIDDRNYLVIMAVQSDGGYARIGVGSFIKYDEGPRLTTAKHVAGTATHAIVGKKTYPLAGIVPKAYGKDWSNYEMPFNFPSVMGLRAIPAGPINFNAPVSMHTFSRNGYTISNAGKLLKERMTGRCYPGTYTSESSMSGSPIVQEGKAVAIHIEADYDRGLNNVQSLSWLVHFPVKKGIMQESDVDAGKSYESEFDASDYYMSAFNPHMRERSRRYMDDFDEFADYINGNRSEARQMLQEMEEVEKQGYTINSREMKAVKRKFFGKSVVQESDYVELGSDFHNGAASPTSTARITPRSATSQVSSFQTPVPMITIPELRKLVQPGGDQAEKPASSQNSSRRRRKKSVPPIITLQQQ